MPVPGTTGPPMVPSLGVAAKILPAASATHRNDVAVSTDLARQSPAPADGSGCQGASGLPGSLSGRRHSRPRPRGIEQRAPLCRIFFRQQNIERHVDEDRVAEIRLAVGGGELQRLGHRVDVGGRVVPHRLRSMPVQDIQRLQHHRPLRPGAAAIDIEVAEAGAARRFDAGLEGRQIVRDEQPAILPLVAHDRGRNVAAVERVVRGVQSVQAPAAGMRALLVRHVLQAACQIGLHETSRRRAAVFRRAGRSPRSSARRGFRAASRR